MVRLLSDVSLFIHHSTNRSGKQRADMTHVYMSEHFTDETIVQVSANQVSSNLGDEAVVLNFENGIYYGLNPVSARIMELLAEPRTVRSIHEVLLEEYDVESERCRQDLINLLEKLREHDLIETD